MWLTHTIPGLCGSPAQFLVVARTQFLICGSPTQFLRSDHPTIPDLCGSPTRFLIHVAHPHDSDLWLTHTF
jgi:hypothetical protein